MAKMSDYQMQDEEGNNLYQWYETEGGTQAFGVPGQGAVFEYIPKGMDLGYGDNQLIAYHGGEVPKEVLDRFPGAAVRDFTTDPAFAIGRDNDDAFSNPLAFIAMTAALAYTAGAAYGAWGGAAAAGEAATGAEGFSAFSTKMGAFDAAEFAAGGAEAAGGVNASAGGVGAAGAAAAGAGEAVGGAAMTGGEAAAGLPAAVQGSGSAVLPAASTPALSGAGAVTPGGIDFMGELGAAEIGGSQIGNIASTGSGLWDQFLGWAGKNQQLAGMLGTGALNIAGGVGKALLDKDTVEQKIRSEKELLAEKTNQERIRDENKRGLIQSGSYFDSKLPVSAPAQQRVLRRPDGSLVFKQPGILAGAR